jgi:hypothetical protein
MYLSDPTALAAFHGAAEVARIIYIELTGKAMRSSNNSLRTSARGVRVPRGGDNLIGSHVFDAVDTYKSYYHFGGDDESDTVILFFNDMEV